MLLNAGCDECVQASPLERWRSNHNVHKYQSTNRSRLRNLKRTAHVLTLRACPRIHPQAAESRRRVRDKRGSAMDAQLIQLRARHHPPAFYCRPSRVCDKMLLLIVSVDSTTADR